MKLPYEVVLFVVDFFLSNSGDFDAIQVCQASNRHFKRTDDWHEFSYLLDYMNNQHIVITDVSSRRIDGMVRYRAVYDKEPDDWV